MVAEAANEGDTVTAGTLVGRGVVRAVLTAGDGTRASAGMRMVTRSGGRLGTETATAPAATGLGAGAGADAALPAAAAT